MSIHPIDYAVIGLHFLFVISVGFIRSPKKGQANLRSFFLSKQNLPWWLMGVSMVATTFSEGTPLLVAGWVHEHGIAKNWEWWGFLLGGMLTTFFFARLWRRTNVINDAEFAELRYAGRGAAALRGFRALYMGFIMNWVILGSGLVAISKIGCTLLNIEPDAQIGGIPARWVVALVSAAAAVAYSTLAGFGGIVINDFVQFCLAMTGAILICIFAVGHESVGGLGGLVDKLTVAAPDKLHFLPAGGSDGSVIGMTFWAFVVALTVRWWSSVYGGSEPGGGAYVAQRMLAARNEQHAMGASVLFNVLHYAVRPWPWILTGLACLLIFPDVADGETAYVRTIDLVPVGLKGIVLASFFAAFMSTVDTRLNLGAAYFVNDFYARFCYRRGSQNHYVLVARIATVLQVLVGFLMLLVVENVKSLFFIYTALGAGSGLVFIVRWYWWRVSAWSEIVAMGASFLIFLVFRFVIYQSEQAFNEHAIRILLISTPLVTLSWVITSCCHRPNPAAVQHLKAFYRQVRPSFGWTPIARTVAEEDGRPVPTDPVRPALLAWISSIVMIYAAIIGLGKLLLGSPGVGLLNLAVFAASLCVLVKAITTMVVTSASRADAARRSK